jgi:hypothetical protein
MNKLVAVAIVLLSGCAAKSIIHPVNKGQAPLASHSEPVCLMRSPMPSAVAYIVVGRVKSSKNTYGSVSELLPLMAADARAVGADAIINLDTGQRMGMLAWSRPVGTGTAIKLADHATFNCLANGGELR